VRPATLVSRPLHCRPPGKSPRLAFSVRLRGEQGTWKSHRSSPAWKKTTSIPDSLHIYLRHCHDCVHTTHTGISGSWIRNPARNYAAAQLHAIGAGLDTGLSSRRPYNMGMNSAAQPSAGSARASRIHLHMHLRPLDDGRTPISV